MSGSPRNTRPPMVVAMQWVSQITTISFEMVLPALFGYWLDSRWGTDPWLLIGGAVLGFAVGMMHLWQLLKPKTNQRRKPDNSGQSTRNSNTKE